jgi:hypothetical protein
MRVDVALSVHMPAPSQYANWFVIDEFYGGVQLRRLPSSWVKPLISLADVQRAGAERMRIPRFASLRRQGHPGATPSGPVLALKHRSATRPPYGPSQLRDSHRNAQSGMV